MTDTINYTDPTTGDEWTDADDALYFDHDHDAMLLDQDDQDYALLQELHQEATMQSCLLQFRETLSDFWNLADRLKAESYTH
jgi:hypothetical protein